MTTRIITISMLGLLVAQAVTATDYHVAPIGSDANPGTQAKPISVKATPDDKSGQEAPRHQTTADNSPGPNRSAAASAARPDVADTVRELVGACKGVWTTPVGEVVAPGFDMAAKANGPLLGNGHVGIQISGTAEQQRFHIAKNDFWTHNSGKVLDCPRALTVGGVTLECPELKDASYRQEQQIYPACVVGAFGKGDHSLATRTWLCRGTNLLAIELRNEGKADLNVQASQWAGDPRPAIPAGANRINIGHWQTYTGQISDQFCGRIRDVHLFSGCLTVQEIAAVRDAAAGAVPATAAWLLPTDKEQLEGLHWAEVPALTGVPFSVTVWLNPAMDETERAVRKRLQFCQTTARDDADAQCVVSHSGNMHGAYNFTNKPLQLDTPTAEPCDEQDSPTSSDCNHVDGKSARR
jgi:hypothetical protein